MLFGYPVGDDDLESPLHLREATVAANVPQLRRIAEFFADAADQLERQGSDFGHAHFCDFAEVPAKLQRTADIIVVPRD
jgi:hypothetical protein